MPVYPGALRVANHMPGIIAAANGTSVRLRDRDQPAGVCVAFPGILDLGERNTSVSMRNVPWAALFITCWNASVSMSQDGMSPS
jgi:hypothetical protein